jgi:hypothetical protein
VVAIQTTHSSVEGVAMKPWIAAVLYALIRSSAAVKRITRSSVEVVAIRRIYFAVAAVETRIIHSFVEAVVKRIIPCSAVAVAIRRICFAVAAETR